MTTFVGIDPGLGGGIAFYVPELGAISVHPMPTHSLVRNAKAKRELDVAALFDLLRERDRDIRHVALERVGAMPGQGVSSMFSFGRTVGQIEGVLTALYLPVTTVAPQTWRKAMNVRGGKDASRLRAQTLLPYDAKLFSRTKDDGVAEAALMAMWCARTVPS
jgi:crossover junction endodeoxyribonuclease RuvC